MFFVQKQTNKRAAFKAIVSPFLSYKELSENGDARDKAKEILLQEQGHLCPFCELSLTVGIATIEHFKPKAIYPELDRDYDNLFACCTICNGRKANHLFPAYIFDPRLNYRILISPEKYSFKYGIDYRYQLEGEHNCMLRSINLDKYPITSRDSEANHFPGSDYWAKVLNHYALDLLDLNNAKRLAEPRRKVHKTLMEIGKTATEEKLLHMLKSIMIHQSSESPVNLEEHISLKVSLLTQILRNRNVNLANHFVDA